MTRPEYSVAECPRSTKCTWTCNLCWFNCDHLKVTVQTETEAVCNGCESTLLALPNGGWEVIN